MAESVIAAPPGARYCFRLAGHADDRALRHLLRETPMDGPVRVSLRREPSYFDASAVDGPSRQTLVVSERRSQRVVAMGCRSVRHRYVDGRVTPVGYLSGLRILPEHRGGTLLARGYREMRGLHENGPADFYVTTIADDNRQALEALAGRRAGLPAYFPLGRYHTFVIPLRHHRTSWREGDLEIRPLGANQFPALIDFLQETGKSKLFFPCYAQEDFLGPRATFQGLAPEDILIARRGSQLVASLGLWDQSRFRQMVVEGYRTAIRCGRPAYNALAWCLGWPRFPACGEPFHTLVAAVPLTSPGHAPEFHKLLMAAGDYVRHNRPHCRSLLVGAFERDPLFGVCRQASLFQYVTHVYVVQWEEPPVHPARFAGRDLYLELGCL